LHKIISIWSEYISGMLDLLETDELEECELELDELDELEELVELELDELEELELEELLELRSVPNINSSLYFIVYTSSSRVYMEKRISEFIRL
jgi:hypothetical protein